MDELVESAASLHIDDDAIDFEIICAKDLYTINKATLTSLSPYFSIACNVDKVFAPVSRQSWI